MSIRHIIKLIPALHKKQGIWITLSAILQALLNMAGLAVLLPLIILVLDPDKLVDYPWFQNHRNLILLSIICFIILKNLLIVWLSKMQVGYINKLYSYYSEKLYDNYYRQGLLFIKDRHSDELTYNTNAVSYLFTHGVLSLTFSIIAEAFLLLSIWCGIFWFSPFTATGICVCLIPFGVIYFYWVRKKLKTYGEREDNAKRRIMTLVGDTFKGYSDIKLNNAHSWFKERFNNHIAEIANSRKWITKAFHIPQGMIECYIVIGMILFIIIGGNTNDTRLILGVLGIAVLRILPSLRTLITMIIQWKNNAFTIDIIKDIYMPVENDNVEGKPVYFQKQIKMDNICFRYPGKDSFILKDFSLIINKGECLGIQGMSGIGKTTLFNLLLGFYKPCKGRIQVDGITLDEQSYTAWQKLIAYVPQDIFVMDATLAENIAFGQEKIDCEQITQAIDQSGLNGYVSSLPDGINTRIGQNGNLLSGGERQRVGIARALYKKAEILLFDEATSSLDSKTENEIMNTIYELLKDIKNLTVVIISHKKSTLVACDKVVNIENSLSCFQTVKLKTLL